MPATLENVMIDSCEGFEHLGITFEEVEQSNAEYSQWLDETEAASIWWNQYENGMVCS